MRFEQLTERARDAMQRAQQIMAERQHTQLDVEHLLLALLDQPDGVVPRLLGQAGADPGALRDDLQAELSRRPRVTGPAAAPGQVMVTQRLARLLDAAEREAGRLKDEYVSVEHADQVLAEALLAAPPVQLEMVA